MILQVRSLEILQRFTPPLRKGTRYTLELPENWCNNFCGFLMCATTTGMYSDNKEITMTHEKGINSQPEFSSNNSDFNNTRVLYFSFGLLKHTAWWDETSNAISFSIKPSIALGVRLIPRKTHSVQMETTDSSQFYYMKSKFADKFQIIHDSKSVLQCYLGLNDKL